jgi:hypothetical protein
VAGAAPWFTCSLNRCVARPMYLWESVQRASDAERGEHNARRAVVPGSGNEPQSTKQRSSRWIHLYMYYNPAAALGDTHHSPITVPACIMMLVPRCDPARSAAHLTGGGGQRKTPIAAALRCTRRSNLHPAMITATRFSLFFVYARWLLALRHFLSGRRSHLSHPLMGTSRAASCVRTPVACF